MGSKTAEYLPLPKGFSTTAVRAFLDLDQSKSSSVVAPLVTATTFKILGPSEVHYYYSRDNNPNRYILENCLAKLDNGKFGLCFSSAVAALSAVAHLYKSGDHLIVCKEIYPGSGEVLNEISTNYGLEVSYVESENIESAIKPKTKLIWVEALTNPNIEVIDIRALAEIGHKHNILLAVDNSFMTPYFLRPLDLGADIVIHSLTKYINGHSDVVMGSLITNNEDLYKRLKHLQNTFGVVPSPYDCCQVTRSLKTLSLRMKQHMMNALEVARYLESHPKIEKVLHPGLQSHPQHELHKAQASGCSGILSFYLKDGEEAARKFLTSLKVFNVAVSFGGPESLVIAPFLIKNLGLNSSLQHVPCTGNPLIRMSVGLEDSEDLIEDVAQALESA